MNMEEGEDTDYPSKGNKSGDMSSQMDTSDPATSQSKKEVFIGRLTKKFDDTAAKSSRPITENIVPLSDILSIEKIAAIKAKKKAQDRAKLATDVDIDEDLIPGRPGSQNLSSVQSKIDDRSHLTQSKYNFDYIPGTSSFISSITTGGADDNDAIFREIMQCERIIRERSNVLQSTGKQFDKDIAAFLSTVEAREQDLLKSSSTISIPTNTIQQTNQNPVGQKARPLGYNRFDQERYSAKDETGGFSIDTKLSYQPNGGAISLSSNTTSQSQNILDNLSSQQSTSVAANTTSVSSQLNINKLQITQLSHQNTNILSSGNGSSNSTKSKYQSSTGSSSSKRIHATPIIIIPAARNSLIQMINAIDILQELK